MDRLLKSVCVTIALTAVAGAATARPSTDPLARPKTRPTTTSTSQTPISPAFHPGAASVALMRVVAIEGVAVYRGPRGLGLKEIKPGDLLPIGGTVATAINAKLTLLAADKQLFSLRGNQQALLTRTGLDLTAAAATLPAELMGQPTIERASFRSVRQPATPTTSAIPTTEAAQAASATDAMPIVVVSLSGKAGYAPPGQTKAKAIKSIGEILAEGGEIRTAAGGQVQIRIGDQHLFTVDELSRIVIRAAAITEGKAKSDLGVPYGRVRFDITSASLANDVTITAPDATLAVKGTIGGMAVRPGFPTQAFGGPTNRGQFTVTYQGNRTATVDQQQATNAQTPDPAQVEQQSTFVEVGDSRARDSDEATFVQGQTTVGQVTLDSNPTPNVPPPPPTPPPPPQGGEKRGGKRVEPKPP